jgi:diguanylate cyclase (GGDEF)-like protein
MIWLLLGHSSKQQRYVLRTLLAVMAYWAGCVVVEIALAYGLVDRGRVRFYEFVSVAGSLLSYMAVRMGWTLRSADPGLTTWQMSFASLLATASYALFDQIRGVLVAVQMAVVVFGTFNLRRRALLRFSASVVITMGIMMWTMHQLHPRQFPIEMELVHFFVLLGLQPSVVVMGSHFGAMRAQLKKNRADLEAAVLRIQEMASRDVLTGLYNRRHALDYLDHLGKGRTRLPSPCALVLLDIDHFKLVNDSYGHGVGDDVLKNFAQQAQEILRDSELIARWGGEEFLLVLPNTAIDGALVAVGRLRMALQNRPITEKDRDLHVNFSSGIVDLKVGEPIDQAIHRADVALYQSKATGRGRDTVHP